MTSIGAAHSSLSSLLASLLNANGNSATQNAVAATPSTNQPSAATTTDSVTLSGKAASALALAVNVSESAGGGSDHVNNDVGTSLTINGKQFNLSDASYQQANGLGVWDDNLPSSAYISSTHSETSSGSTIESKGVYYQSLTVSDEDQFVINLDANGNPIKVGDTSTPAAYTVTVDEETQFSMSTVSNATAEINGTPDSQAVNEIASTINASSSKDQGLYEKYRQMLEAQQAKQSGASVTA
jgi:hypothetical protein